MKPKSVSGITCYVKDLKETEAFYEKLGFEFKSKTKTVSTAYLNWFWMEFVSMDKEDKPGTGEEAYLPNKGAGMFICMSVDNVDEFYQGVVDAGLSPTSEPKDWPWGRREFVLRDPDGYKLVFFKKK